MPKYSVEVNFVNEVIVEVTNDEEALLDEAFELIDKPKFIELYQAKFSGATKEAAEKCWDNLFGNNPIAPDIDPDWNSPNRMKNNPHFHYLTQDSCKKILEHLHLFHNGIDFQHLPSGFLIVKNTTGICDVLHYSSYIATHHPNPSPLAIVLADKRSEHGEFDESGFEPKEAAWYVFLKTKLISKGQLFCTEEELRKAFIDFSNTLRKLGLEFYELDFSTCETLKEDFHPITLLGRWHTVLTNRHLKKEDLKEQWQVLPHLPLVHSADAIRAITDHENEEKPCGLLLPEMRCNHELFDAKHLGFRTVIHHNDIIDEAMFWRYIAFQPKRRSIEFYREALKKINEMSLGGKLNPEYKNNKALMYEILAGSTTGDNYSEDEAKDKINWENLCAELDGREELTHWFFLDWRGKSKDFRTRTDKTKPNLAFLNIIVQHYKNKAARFLPEIDPHNLGDWRTTPYAGDYRFEGMTELSIGIGFHGNGVYQGAKFYFKEGTWVKLDLVSYSKLQNLFRQYQIKKNSSREATSFFYNTVPHISTFNIETEDHVRQLFSRVSPGMKTTLLEQCLNIFKDIEKNDGLTVNTLLELIDYINTTNFGENPLLDILTHLESKFKPLFRAGYFEEKKELVLNPRLTLVEEELRRYYFSTDQNEAIASFQLAILRRNPFYNVDIISGHLSNLRHLTTPEDFTLFTQRLASMSSELAADADSFRLLTNLLCKKKTFDGFNQIFLRNKIEKSPAHTIKKFLFFLEKLLPLTQVPLAVETIALQEAIASIVLNSDESSLTAEAYKEFIRQINAVATTHPHVQSHLLGAIQYVPGKHTAAYFEHVTQYIKATASLAQLLPPGTDELSKDNMLVFYSLLANCHKKPQELVSLLKEVNKLTDPAQKYFMLVFISRLLDNQQSLEGLGELIGKFIGQPTLFTTFQSHCNTPPYPSISNLLTWLQGDSFESDYKAFSLKPHGDRRLDFAFQSEKYKSQRSKFVGLEPRGLFTDELADEFSQQLTANREKTMAELLEALLPLKERARSAPLTHRELLSLLCLTAEVLARTSTQKDDQTPPQLISQELNTTQIMALYAMLTNPKNKVISEIETGEGKSRIMMVLAACQAMQGKTVDFITSDMQLAERDYLTYKQFFTALGIRSSIISLATPKELYQFGGVNFSDNNQLPLLRNKSDVMGESSAYLAKEVSDRCLLVDEVDTFKDSRSKDPRNFATSSKQSAGFVWIYPLLMRYIQSGKSHENIDAFINYVKTNDAVLQHQANLATLHEENPHQIKTWLNAAYIASQMQVDMDYKITPADEDKLFAVRDHEGHTRYSRKVLVLDNGRPMEGSTFSDGVHQCLCAKENLRVGQEAFVIPPENRTKRSSYPRTFMATYGKLFGVSGTTRSAAAREKPDTINYDDYSYLIVPREKQLIRDDKNTWLAKDQKQQILFLKRAITEKLKKGLPVLLICSDDKQSFELHMALTSDKKFMALFTKVQRVHALTPSDEEKEAIASAGQPGILTISTAGMFGRGVDINASNLFVISAYVPTLEDEKQIKGRTARAGKPGEFRMILNAAEPTAAIRATHNIDNEVSHLQKARALQAVFEEEICSLYAFFLEDVTQHFLTGYATTAEAEKKALLNKWLEFLSAMQKDWNLKAPSLKAYVEKEDKEGFTKAFNEFMDKWLALKPVYASSKPVKALEASQISKIYTGLVSQKSFFTHQSHTIKKQAQYDVADDGQARIYTRLFAQTIASLKGDRQFFANFKAWREGRGVLFADLQAVLRGERPLFANLIATIKSLFPSKESKPSP
jgi:hypothetical protein